MSKILDLRKKAKKQPGAKFDLRQFHEVVLTNGPVPPDLLEGLVKVFELAYRPDLDIIRK